MYVKTSHKRRRFLMPLTSVCALCVGLASPTLAQGTQDKPQDEPVVNVTDYDVVDLAVKDAELAQVLQMLSLQSRKNIIASKNVSGTVTANLYDVTFAEALDAILSVNGYTWEERANFIYVYTTEEWEIMREAERTTESRIFTLDHLSATTAIEMITPFLSDSGKAAAQGDVESGFAPDSSDGGANEYAYAVRVVVNDFPENVAKIAEILAQLDEKPDQVQIEATILQTQLDESNAFGIDISVVGSLNFADIITPINPVRDLLRGNNGGFVPNPNNLPAGAGQSTVGNTPGPGGLKVGVISNDISVFLRVLNEVTDSVILARPKITVLNRQRAEVLVGARIGYLSSTTTQTTTTQTVEFLDTGVHLILRPFISKDGTIRMELSPSVSEASLRTVTDSGGAQVTIPDEITNQVTTNVRVHDGQTLVLGGLFRESTQVSRRQVPILGDIPVLGGLFRGQDDTVNRKEVIFLITPTITHDQTLWEAGAAMNSLVDFVRIGGRRGLLGFSQTKMIMSHNQAAVDARNRGKTGLAKYHLQNSLRLQPNQAEVIRMRQELSGDQERNFENSLLERVLNKETAEDVSVQGTFQTGKKTAFQSDWHDNTFTNVTWTESNSEMTESFTAEPMEHERSFQENANPEMVEEGASFDDQFSSEPAAPKFNLDDWRQSQDEVQPMTMQPTGTDPLANLNTGLDAESYLQFFGDRDDTDIAGTRRQSNAGPSDGWWFLPFSWNWSASHENNNVANVPTSAFE